ncbi:MAG TPA: hypothetical protein VFH42_00215 [Sporolactobacillaceae bacterium]|nr:hypothetical protein [Sporolactobacillaceae bacterium]
MKANRLVKGRLAFFNLFIYSFSLFRGLWTELAAVCLKRNLGGHNIGWAARNVVLLSFPGSPFG